MQKLVLAIVVSVVSLFGSPSVFAEEGLDKLTLHSIEVLAVSSSLSDSELDAFRQAANALAGAALVSPPTAVKSLAIKAVSTAYELSSTGTIDLYNRADTLVDALIILYQSADFFDDLAIYVLPGKNGFIDQIFGGDGGRLVFAGQKYQLGRSFTFRRSGEGRQVLLRDIDFPSNDDSLGQITFRQNRSEEFIPLVVASTEEGSLYELVYSYQADKGRHADLGGLDKVIVPEPFYVEVTASFQNGFIKPLEPLDLSPLSQLVSANYDASYELIPLAGYVAAVEGDCGGSTVRTTGPNNYTYTTGKITDDCGFNVEFLLVDNDGDGVGDSIDLCPGTTPASSVDESGCAASQRDTDQDGVTDDIDQCSATPANALVNTQGCADRDGDGTADTDDAFPDDPDEDKDTDGDGVGDNADDFPNSVTTLVQSRGDSASVQVAIQPQLRSSSCSLTSTEVSPFQGAGTMSLDFQVGFILNGCEAGESVQVEIDFGEAWPEGALVYKVNGRKLVQVIGVAPESGTIVTYTLTDNGPLDTDPTDGALQDPVTMAVPPSIPTVPYWLLAMLGVLLCLLASSRLRAV